jgi:hypothetical protein
MYLNRTRSEPCQDSIGTSSRLDQDQSRLVPNLTKKLIGPGQDTSRPDRDLIRTPIGIGQDTLGPSYDTAMTLLRLVGTQVRHH